MTTRWSDADIANTKCKRDLNNCQTSFPKIDSIVPPQGDINGGFDISINGSNFLTNAEEASGDSIITADGGPPMGPGGGRSKIFFENIEITNATITNTKITFTAPPFKWDLVNSSRQIYITVRNNNIASRAIYKFIGSIIPTFDSITPSTNLNITGSEIANISSNIFSNAYQGFPKYINFIFNNKNKLRIPIQSADKITMPVFFSGDNSSESSSIPLPTKKNYAIVYVSVEILGQEYKSVAKIVIYKDPFINDVEDYGSWSERGKVQLRIYGSNLYTPNAKLPIIYIEKGNILVNYTIKSSTSTEIIADTDMSTPEDEDDEYRRGISIGFENAISNEVFEKIDY